jgi:non-specific serine/threonine protein kinase
MAPLHESTGSGCLSCGRHGSWQDHQVIALLNYIRSEEEKTLLIIPASLIGNWITEIDKFAPSLKYYTLHPSENGSQSIDELQPTGEYELFFTTYSMLSSTSG